MNRFFATATAFAFVGMAVFSMMTTAEPDNGLMIDAPSGEEYLTPASSGNDAVTECTQEAVGPVDGYYCNNGDHVRAPSFLFGHTCDAGGSFTGHVHSILTWEGEDRHLLCTFEGGELTGFEGLGGEHPDVGSEYRHDCWSYEWGTAELLPAPNGLGGVLTQGEAQTDPIGVVGGLGTWSCLVVEI